MNFSEIGILLIVIIGSVILHELMHGVVAYWLGDRTAKEAGRLTLNPLKHIDPIMSILVPVLLFFTGGPVFGGAKPVPVNTRNLKGGAWGMALVAIVGPLTNFLLAFIAFAVGHFSGVMYAPGLGRFAVLQMISTNLGFFLFNILPIPPLDGSRVLYAIAPDGVRIWLEKIEKFGIIIIYALLLIAGGFFSTYMGQGINGIYNWFYKIFGV